ncbi:MAG: ATP-binding protein [Bacteroidota bacterium]
MITRSLKERLIEDLKEGKKIILLYGSRQVGKTTLIKKVIQELDYKILSLDADATDQLDVLSSRNPEKIRLLIGDHDLLFIDEAQRIPDIGINLKIIHDQMPEKRVIVSGSSSLDLANRVIEPLTGRTWTYTLYPISLQEWQIYKQLPKQFPKSALETLLLYGSYPEQLTINDERRKIQYLHELRQAYLYKDVLALGNIRYPEKLDQLLQLLSYQVGQLVSIQELANTLQINRETVNNYIDLLEKAFVIFKLPGFSRNLRKEITKMSKIYFYDLGVRNAIINNFSPVNLRDDVGALWENFLLAERKKYLAYSFNYANTYFWNTHTGAEVDYVEERNGKYHGFEFKWNPKKFKKTYQPWINAYPEATYECITPEQLGDWLL